MVKTRGSSCIKKIKNKLIKTMINNSAEHDFPSPVVPVAYPPGPWWPW